MLPTTTATHPARTYKSLALYKEPKEKIALISSTSIKRFPVYLDREIGISKKYHHLTAKNVLLSPFSK